MPTHQFSLKSDLEYIALDKLLKLMRFVQSGGEAHAAIQEGLVRVNGIAETQKRKKLRAGDTVEFNEERIKIS